MIYFRINDDNTLTQLEEPEQGCLEVESVPDGAIIGYYRYNESLNRVEVDYERELKELKEELIEKNKELYEEYIKVALQGYSEYEVKTWDQQVNEARYYMQHKSENGVEAHTPLLSELAKNRGVSVYIIANKVLMKSQMYLKLTGAMLGMKQKIDSMIDSITDIGSLISEDEIESRYKSIFVEID